VTGLTGDHGALNLEIGGFAHSDARSLVETRGRAERLSFRWLRYAVGRVALIPAALRPAPEAWDFLPTSIGSNV
jgi:hypothetical protein